MRRSEIRLRHHDYRDPGVYLVTLVSAGRATLFGVVDREGVRLSPFGEIARDHIELLPVRRPTVEVTDSIIMPDHLHLILTFAAPTSCGLGGVINAFKGGISRDVNLLRRTPGALVWQDNYWERVVRTIHELERLRAYLADNPRRWFERNQVR